MGLSTRTIALVGLPGAGKTMLSRLLARGLGWQRFSTGEALRNLAVSDSALSAQLADGQLAPEETVAELIQRFLRTTVHRVLDGYPRHTTQAEWLMAECPEVLLVHLFVPRRIAQIRLFERARRETRPEDNDVEAIERRLDEAERDLTLMLQLAGKRTIDIDATAPEDVVYSDTLERLKR